MKKFFRTTISLLISVMLLLGCVAPVFAQSSSDTFTAADENCTGVYVGKKVSKDGTTIIARCADTHPTTTSQYLKIQKAVSGQYKRFATGKNGFKRELPKKTYRYISIPRPVALEKGNEWDSAAMNECGLAVTATVTAYINDKARMWDPYVEDGLSEDNIAGIIVATCATAKQAIQTIATIIDEQGSAESNIFMVADQNEAWYMEIYSGHQYAAVKMPEDKVAVFGNEFMLDTLDGFEDRIISADLIKLAEKNKAAVYHNGSFDPFASYVGTTWLADYANLRTWRGHQLFAPSTAGKYMTHTKYQLFFDPDHKISDEEIISLLRDRMEGVVSNDVMEKGYTRIIASETAAHAHLLKIHSNYPAQMAVEMWLCMSNAAYAPFVPISNAITEAEEHYTHIIKEYGPDEKSASQVYKKLNTLAAQNREKYGLGIEEYWTEWESVKRLQNSKLLEDAAKLYSKRNIARAKKILTDYSVSVQADAIASSQRIFDELLWFMEENTDTLQYAFSYNTLQYGEREYTANFSPNVVIKDYAKDYGWTYRKTSKGITLTRDNKTITICPADGKRTSMGTITIDGMTNPVDCRQRGDIAYMRHTDAAKYIKGEMKN